MQASELEITVYRIFAFLLFSILLFISRVTSLVASEHDLRFVRGLADRNLFESVEIFCAEEFDRIDESNRPLLSRTEQYALAAELLRSRSLQMLQAEPHRRPVLQKGLDELTQRYLTGADDTTKPEETLARLALLFQRVIADASLGEWQYHEANMATSAQRTDLLHEARQKLLEAVEGYQRCVERLNALHGRQGVARNQDFEQKWLGLLRSVQIQHGLAQKSLALSFAPGSADRQFSLNAAVEILEEPTQTTIRDEIIYRAKIELASCFRLLGQQGRCLQLLQELQQLLQQSAQQESVSMALRFQAETERLRYLLAAEKFDEARENYLAERAGSECWPDFDIARLELFIALGRLLREQAQNNAAVPNEESPPFDAVLMQEILNLTRQIEDSCGAFWGRRARMLLVESSLSEQPNGNEALLLELGKAQYHNGRFSESVRLFDQATDLALERNRAAAAFESVLASAQILRERLAQWEQGGTPESDVAQAPDLTTLPESAALRARITERLCNVAKHFSEEQQAPEIFLTAIDTAGQRVLKQEMSVRDFVTLHAEFADRWPHAPKTPAVLLRAAELLATENDTQATLNLLEKISNHTLSSDEMGLRIVVLAKKMWEAQLTADSEEKTLEAATWFAKRLPQTLPQDAQPPESPASTTWNAVDAASGILAAEHFVRAASHGTDSAQSSEFAQQAEQILRQISLHCPDLPPAQQAQVQALLVTILLKQGRQEEGQLAMQNLNANQIASLSPTERQQFLRTQVTLLVDTGQVRDAIKLAREMLQESPKNRECHEMLASVLMCSSQPVDHEEALNIWTKIALGTEKNSEPWWKARENMLDVYVKQGQMTEARRQFDRLQILYPELGGPARKQRLENLLREP